MKLEHFWLYPVDLYKLWIRVGSNSDPTVHAVRTVLPIFYFSSLFSCDEMNKKYVRECSVVFFLGFFHVKSSFSFLSMCSLVSTWWVEGISVIFSYGFVERGGTAFSVEGRSEWRAVEQQHRATLDVCRRLFWVACSGAATSGIFCIACFHATSFLYVGRHRPPQT